MNPPLDITTPTCDGASLEASVPVTVCRLLPAFVAKDPQTVWWMFRGVRPMRFRQAWRPEPEPDFAPATVRVGWRADCVLVFAELVGADIFNAATGLNQETWLLGDTFEIFLQPPGGRAYVELHVTPDNQRLQLRYDGTDTHNGSWQQALVREELFRSSTWVWPEVERWFVYAEIPVASAGEHRLQPGDEWRISFGRYDYRRAARAPILSSTSAHAEPDFHRQHEWSAIRIETEN